MKKIFTLLATLMACILFATTSTAQIKKGATLLGGDFGGSIQSTTTNGVDEKDYKSIYVSPVFGKAIKENLILGADIFTNFYNTENSDAINNDLDVSAYGLGIFLRQYKFIGNSGFSIFLQSRLSGARYDEKHTRPSYSDKLKRYTVTLNLNPGISYALSKALQLETGFANLFYMSYYSEKHEVQDVVSSTEKTHAFSLNTSLNNFSNIYIGFRLLFN